MVKTALSKTVKKKSPAAGAFSYLLHFSTLWEFLASKATIARAHELQGVLFISGTCRGHE